MKLENVSKIYKNKRHEIKALDNISLNLEPGKFYAIMGSSGSGKTTLIKILGLIDTITSGTYTINNLDVSKLKDKELSDIRMKHIGFVFQNFYLDDNLKVLENVMLPMLINKEINPKERPKIAAKLLTELGLENRLDHYPPELSGGESQRVSIARSLANNPNIILADEPTGNLDEENEKIVFSELKKLSKKGKCIVVVSHSKNVKEYADVIIKISNGKIVENNK